MPARRPTPISRPSRRRGASAASRAPASGPRRRAARGRRRRAGGGPPRRGAAQPHGLRGKVVIAARAPPSRAPGLLPQWNMVEKRAVAAPSGGGVRHLQRQRVPRAVPGRDADLLHVLAAPRRRGEAVVHRGALPAASSPDREIRDGEHAAIDDAKGRTRPPPAPGTTCPGHPADGRRDGDADLANVFSKILVARYPVGEVMFGRSAIAFALSCALVLPGAGFRAFVTRRPGATSPAACRRRCPRPSRCWRWADAARRRHGDRLSAPLFAAWWRSCGAASPPTGALGDAVTGFAGVLVVTNPGPRRSSSARCSPSATR